MERLSAAELSEERRKQLLDNGTQLVLFAQPMTAGYVVKSVEINPDAPGA